MKYWRVIALTSAAWLVLVIVATIIVVSYFKTTGASLQATSSNAAALQVTSAGASTAYQVARLVATPILFFVISVVVGVFAFRVDAVDRESYAAARKAAADVVASGGTQPALPSAEDARWRSFALGSLAVVALGGAILSLGGLGQIRQQTSFKAVARTIQYCDSNSRCTFDSNSMAHGAKLKSVPISYVIAVWAPLIATQNQPVAIDEKITATTPGDGPAYISKPALAYGCLAKDSKDCAAFTSIEGANSAEDEANSFFWRFIVKYADSGFVPIDLRLSLNSAPLYTPLVNIDVVPSFALTSVSQSATTIAGIVTTLLGIIGSLVAFVKGQNTS